MLISQEKKLSLARRWMMIARHEYENLMQVEAAVMGSIGLTARYDAIGGGHSGVLSDHTARNALYTIRIDGQYRKKMKWLDVIFTVYEGYNSLKKDGKTKGLMEGLHDRCVARVIYGKVFKGYSMSYIGRAMISEHASISRQAVYKLWLEAAEAVAAEADRMGLYNSQDMYP